MFRPLAYFLRRGLCAPLLILLAVASRGATNNDAWLYRAWRTDDGLPNNSVYGIAQTPDGYIWIGTSPTGLSRFDGVHFEEFSSTNFVNDPSRANRGILAMIRGRDGFLHMAMDRAAIVRLTDHGVQTFLADREVPNLLPYSLAVDGEGALWIAYRGGSICRIKERNVTRFREEDGLPAGVNICGLAADAKGRLWFAKNGKLGVFRDGRLQTLTEIDPAPTRLASARKGGVWICAGFHLFRYNEGGSLEDFGEFNPKSTGSEPSVMLEDRDGAVWIGTSFSGLFRFGGARFESIPTSHQAILSLMEDAEGNLWVGTDGGGLNRVRPRAVELEAAESGLPFEAVQSLCQDTRGVVWAAVQNGALARRAGGRWVTVPTSAEWAGDATCVSADPSGDVWVGTRFHGLLRWQTNGFVAVDGMERTRGQTIHTLLVTKTGDVWLGEETPTTVQRLRGGKLETFPVPPDIRIIRATAEDAAGNIWFGTSKGVLLRVAGEKLTDETALMGSTLLPIRHLYATPDGSVWIGFAGWGVGRIKDGKFALIGVRQGLYDEFVSQIIADGRGWMWFGAGRGIFKVRQEELDAVAEGRAPRVRSIHYGRGEGLPSLQANFGDSPTALRSRDGRLWLPMRTALAVIDPQKFAENSQPPPVLIHRVRVSDQIVAFYGGALPLPQTRGRELLDPQSPAVKLRVPPDHRRIEFEYTALSFVGPENVHFRYRLDGFDGDWFDAGTSRSSLPYPRLPAGDYQFHVTACNSEGVWNEIGASLSLVVVPFFWQTWWFRSTTLAAFTVMVIAIVRYVSFRRLRRQLLVLEQQAALHKERARIAKDIHDDLGASLTQISLLGELAEQDRGAPDKAVEHIRTISTTARRAVKSLDEIVWAVNPRNDTLAHFIDYTGQFAPDYLRVAGIRCRLDLPEQTPERELSTDVRHNLFLVVKEAINNTVKHAHATELWLSVSVADEKLQITIEDNGRGFDCDPTDPGADGLRNMRARAADIGGQCVIQGRPGAGAKVTVEMALAGNAG